MQTLNLVTWNVRGIRNQTKKTKIINHLIKLKVDICFLQETHLTNSEQQYLKTKEYDKIFSSTYNSKHRGVSILVGKNIPLIHNSSVIDPEGRFIIINVSLYHSTFTLANIYGPNSDDPNFFHCFFSLLHDTTNIILGGDFNTVINPSTDRSSVLDNSKKWHSTEIIKQYMDDYGLCDSWRGRNPVLKEY